jgi:hypothetical protein
MNASLFALVLGFILMSAAPAVADLGDFVSGLANLTKQSVTAPAQTIINSVNAINGGAKPQTILDPTKNFLQATGQTINNGSNVVAGVQNDIYNQAQQLAHNTGTVGDFVFDVASFSQRFQHQWEQSQAQALGGVLQGQNALAFVTSPLAAAIRGGRERYINNAQPLAADVKAGLSGFYAPACWTALAGPLANLRSLCPTASDRS